MLPAHRRSSPGLWYRIGVVSLCLSSSLCAQGPLVLQSDFGLSEGSVAAMKGAAMSVSRDLLIFDLTHSIERFSVWEAAFRLKENTPYWPPGTVFVSVVDPGVGTDQMSVVLKTESGHYFVSPDNGSLMFVAEEFGIEELREIEVDAVPAGSSARYHTFRGRDIYAVAGARLASGLVFFSQIGRRLKPKVVQIEHVRAHIEGGLIHGTIPVVDLRFGNVWSNIEIGHFEELGIETGDVVQVQVMHMGKLKYDARLPFASTFADVPQGEGLIFVNNIGGISMAINRGDFARTHDIRSGPEWTVRFAP